MTQNITRNFITFLMLSTIDQFHCQISPQIECLLWWWDKGKTFLLTTIFCFSSYHLFQLEKFPRNNEDHEIIFEGSTGKKWSKIYIGVFLFKLSLFFSLHFSLVFLTGWWSFECGLIDLSPLRNSVIKVVYNHWNCWMFQAVQGTLIQMDS